MGDIGRWLDPDWRMRCLAWWEGYDLEALKAMRLQQALSQSLRSTPVETAHQRPAHDPAANLIADVATKAVTAVLGSVTHNHEQNSGRTAWSQDQVVASEYLWGCGRIGPSKDDDVIEVAYGLGLDRKNDILDAAAGLGGTARALAAATGSRVIGLEPDPLLAFLAGNHTANSTAGTSAPVYTYDPDRFVPPGQFDLVIADGILRRVSDPELFSDGLLRSLRSGGMLLLSDYVIGDRMPARAVKHWLEAERDTCIRLSQRDVQSCLESAKTKTMKAEDATEAHRHSILSALRGLLRHLDGIGGEGLPLRAVASEISLWNARLSAMANGVSYLRLVVERR